MHETGHWMLDVRVAKIVLAAWVAAVLVYGLWRSRGAAAQDPIRESGPIL
ncbi:MAG TPA: hypothetical protein VFV19_15615 [Candidatus Polarisedimenticolaceae bacterium]|nr:hypothetical protein [Candidatus Polarisedimenticolaceae bacterium]